MTDRAETLEVLRHLIGEELVRLTAYPDSDESLVRLCRMLVASGSPRGQEILERLRKTPTIVPIPGGRVQLDFEILRDLFTIAQGAWEPHMVVVADRFLRPDQVVIDAGAHIGYFTILAAAKVGPNGRVLAIEPSPLNLSRLKRNLELSEIGGCTTICPVAVGERQGTVTLYSDGNSGGTEFSLYSVRHGGQSAGNVEVRSLDELCIEHNVDTVDFIKIDVEGAELATLVGAQQVMARSPRLKIVVELHPWVVAPEEVCRFLAASGFFLYDLGAGFSRFDAERAQQRFEDGGDVFASKVALPET